MAYIVGAILKTERDDGDGGTEYIVHQEIAESGLPQQMDHQDWVHFAADLYPMETHGYMDFVTRDVRFSLSVAGIQLGTFYGNFEEDQALIHVNFELQAFKGFITYFLREKKVWVDYTVKSEFRVWQEFQKLPSWRTEKVNRIEIEE